MIELLMRTTAIAASGLALLGWALFGIDQTRDASDASRAEIAGQMATSTVDPTPSQERAREAMHSKPREMVDDANDVLLAPFAPLVEGSTSEWVRRTVPMLLALLIYGFGLGFLSRFARGVAYGPSYR